MNAISEWLSASFSQPNFISAVSLIVATIALLLNWLNRRSQKSARIAIELFPKKDGVFLSLSNVGDRIAYDCKLAIEPKRLAYALGNVSVIAPQRSYEVFLCHHVDIPSEKIQVVISYHDPAHKKRLAVDRASFDTSCLGGYIVSPNKDFGCLMVER